jgi:hypothetical protein
MHLVGFIIRIRVECSCVAMGWMIQGSNSGEGKIFLSSPNLSDWVWGPHSHLFSEYCGFFYHGQVVEA